MCVQKTNGNVLVRTLTAYGEYPCILAGGIVLYPPLVAWWRGILCCHLYDNPLEWIL